MQKSSQVTVAGKTLALSNLEKVFYPASQFTKGQVIHYYIAIAPVLLPHLKNRALTLKRYPGGANGEFFYEKRCPSFRPNWLKTAPVWSKTNRQNINYCLANDLPSLVWAANLANLELHTSLALFKRPDRPTVLVFDLDPGPAANIIDCARVAIWLRDFLSSRNLVCFPKTSGSKGLQIYAPLNTPVTFDQTKEFARKTAARLAEQHPEKVLTRMAKQLRTDKIFIDWSQNDSHKTTVCVYSLRARDRPTVSTPVSWGELEAAVKNNSPASLSFEAGETLLRVQKLGDLFAPVLTLKQKLSGFE